MNILEREIIEKFRRLDPDARQRVLQTLANATQSSFDYMGWWAEVDGLQAEIHARLGNAGTVGSLSLLAELREEAS